MLISSVGAAEIVHDKACKLRFGWVERQPLAYQLKSGKMAGLQTELTREVTQNIGCELTFVKASWTKLIELTKNGEIDFMGGASPLPERESYAYFSDSYRQDAFAVYVDDASKSNYQFNSLAQLQANQFRLGISRGYVYGDFIEKWKQSEKFKSLLTISESSTENVGLLESGKIDGFLEDPFIVFYKIRSNQIQNPLSALPIKAFGLKSNYMFSKKTVSLETVEKFNLALREVLNTSTKYRYWLGTN